MNRRTFLIGLALGLGTAPAMARDAMTRHIERQLRAQGFTRIKVSRTWLGRTRIEATSKTQHREIIVNPRTGEILRDYWRPLAPGETLNDDKLMDSRDSHDRDGAGDGGGGGDDGGGDGGGDDGGGDDGGGDDGGGDSGGDGGDD